MQAHFRIYLSNNFSFSHRGCPADTNEPDKQLKLGLFYSTCIRRKDSPCPIEIIACDDVDDYNLI